MKKALIIGRTNWEDKFYVKLRADNKVIKSLMRISQSLRDDYFEYNYADSKRITHYEDWADEIIPIRTKDFEIDIVCGAKTVHMIWNKYPSLLLANGILERFCEWVEVAPDTFKKEKNNL